MQGLYVGYSSTVVGHTYAAWQASLFGAYANNVKCM